MLLLGVQCVCVVWVCAVCGCVGVLLVFCWSWVCALLCVVVVCRTLSQDHGIHIHEDVHVGVTLFAQTV